MTVQLWMAIPFALLLLLIAVGPLLFPEFSESNRNKFIVTAIIAVPTAIVMTVLGLGVPVLHQVLFDYFPFMMLLLSLYVITGGIQIKGDMVATPNVNAGILFLGFILASFMGTTGAAMLLIRFLLETNSQRKYRTHTVLFFIALVANCGGILTPLGDPPLFLLYLRGAPFTWFAQLLPQWALTGLLLLAIYYIIDSHYYKKEPVENKKQDLRQFSPVRFKGKINFIYLLLVILGVMFLNPSHIPAMEGHGPLSFLREILFAILIVLSLKTTPRSIRSFNNFSWDPIAEVAILFLGIFVTMTPALMYLYQHAHELGLTRPWEFFYATGLLSSFLDNSPTAVAFYEVALGLGNVEGAETIAGVSPLLLKAISLGAVFFGALTYIGNGPNFMVKSIAEKEGVRMPSFFGYMVKFSLCILLPVYVLIQLIFLPF
ncbi:MAG: sodium:proton antiporter [Bacteroidales bacterium]|nr:sodium:proton antiporter [Bacteroidales bacterium]